MTSQFMNKIVMFFETNFDVYDTVFGTWSIFPNVAVNAKGGDFWQYGHIDDV